MANEKTTKEARKQISFVANAKNFHLIEYLDEIAAKQSRSRNNLVNMILAKYVKEHLNDK